MDEYYFMDEVFQKLYHYSQDEGVKSKITPTPAAKLKHLLWSLYKPNSTALFYKSNLSINIISYQSEVRSGIIIKITKKIIQQYAGQ